MEEFIAQAAAKFGLSEDSISGLTGGILGKLKSVASADQFGQLADKVPGLQGLIDKAGAGESSGGGGLLGGLAGAVGLGGGDLMGLVSKSGLDISSFGDFVSSLSEFLKAKAGDGVVGDLLAKVPGLGKFLG